MDSMLGSNHSVRQDRLKFNPVPDCFHLRKTVIAVAVPVRMFKQVKGKVCVCVRWHKIRKIH